MTQAKTEAGWTSVPLDPPVGKRWRVRVGGVAAWLADTETEMTCDAAQAKTWPAHFSAAKAARFAKNRHNCKTRVEVVPNDQTQARAEAGEARCSESPGAHCSAVRRQKGNR